jgi:hypothetical protein
MTEKKIEIWVDRNTGETIQEIKDFCDDILREFKWPK